MKSKIEQKKIGKKIKVGPSYRGSAYPYDPALKNWHPLGAKTYYFKNIMYRLVFSSILGVKGYESLSVALPEFILFFLACSRPNFLAQGSEP